VYLVTLAYNISLDNPLAPADRRVLAALELGEAGMRMITGQESDLTQPVEVDDEARMMRCYRLKSGALYAAAAKSGALLCGASVGEAESIESAGLYLGLSYQFLDDIADVVAGIDQVGKHAGMDLGKRTAVQLFGLEAAHRRAAQFQQQALSLIEQFGPEADWLRCLVTQASFAPA
jgi:geranylgeranyl pyrophosphate synthase